MRCLILNVRSYLGQCSANNFDLISCSVFTQVLNWTCLVVSVYFSLLRYFVLWSYANTPPVFARLDWLKGTRELLRDTLGLPFHLNGRVT